MKLEDQVCSLELAKRLKELGVKQDSLYRWQNPFNDNYWEPTGLKKEYIESNNHNPENYSAFTVAELGEMLPSEFDIRINDDISIFNFIQWKVNNKFMINYYNSFPRDYDRSLPSADLHVKIHISSNHLIDTNEANARALMLIYLIENGLIKI